MRASSTDLQIVTMLSRQLGEAVLGGGWLDRKFPPAQGGYEKRFTSTPRPAIGSYVRYPGTRLASLRGMGGRTR
jgi:hypothetical protein